MTIQEMRDEASVEAEVLTAINIIASNHGCTIDAVDLESHTIHLSGNKEREFNCAVAIGDYFEALGDRIAKEEAMKFEHSLTGCGNDCAC